MKRKAAMAGALLAASITLTILTAVPAMANHPPTPLGRALEL